MMGNRKLLCQVLSGACVAAFGLGTGACSDDSNNGATSGAGAATAAGAGAAGAGASSAMSTPCSDAYKHFSVGPSGTLVTDAASNVAMRVDDGPVPPIFGNNTWTVSLTDTATGAPAANAHITWGCAFMSVHGHGSNPKRLEDLGGGRYTVHDQNTRMFGPWEVQFWIDPTGATPDYVPTTIIQDGKQCNPTTGPKGKPNFEFKICVPESTD